jgi:hypothetical protein
MRIWLPEQTQDISPSSAGRRYDSPIEVAQIRQRGRVSPTVHYHYKSLCSTSPYSRRLYIFLYSKASILPISGKWAALVATQLSMQHPISRATFQWKSVPNPSQIIQKTMRRPVRRGSLRMRRGRCQSADASIHGQQ